MHRIAAVAMLAVGVCSGAMIDVRDDHYLTLNAGDSVVVDFPVRSWATTITMAGYGGVVPDSPLSGRMYTDTLVHVQFESVDGSLTYDAGQSQAVFSHYYFHTGGKVLWEGDGFAVGGGYHYIADIIESGTVRLRFTNLGVPLTFGDPIHWVFDAPRLGVIYSGNGLSQGAGQPIAAYKIEAETPEPASIALCGIALSVALLCRARGRSSLLR